MHSLLALTLSFGLLWGYLDWTCDDSQQVALQQSQLSRIIRTEPVPDKPLPRNHPLGTDKPRLAATLSEKASRVATVLLNLKLEMITNIEHSAADNHWQPAKSASFFKEPEAEPTVSYNAELVFDAKEGESITGGKVNIVIPI